MDTPIEKDSFVFIVGSPRSGTTLLGELLDRHPQVSQWYEPYFVWDHLFRDASHDERTAADATVDVRRQIFKDFSRYRQQQRCLALIDKSPRNSLKILFILEIFPRAKFIHLLRDGRDATLSIHKEWLRRRRIFQNPAKEGRFDYVGAVEVIRNFLARQPFLSDKLRALWFETHGHLFNKKKQLNRLRWKGEIGWGPRFKGWEEVYARTSLLQFNAYQWLNCIQAIQQNWEFIPPKNRLKVRYEDLITHPEKKINEIIHFIGVHSSQKFIEALPGLKAGNYDKWKREFSREQLEELISILTPALIDLGYAESTEWLDTI
jgi:hypothetical protein